MLSRHSRDNNENHPHGYHRIEPQEVNVAYNGYHMVPMATTNAAVKSLDSKWTPRRHFSGIRGHRKTKWKSMKLEGLVLVARDGIEPPTPAFSGLRSTD